MSRNEMTHINRVFGSTPPFENQLHTSSISSTPPFKNQLHTISSTISQFHLATLEKYEANVRVCHIEVL
jgi:hypothetical protein